MYIHVGVKKEKRRERGREKSKERGRDKSKERGRNRSRERARDRSRERDQEQTREKEKEHPRSGDRCVLCLVYVHMWVFSCGHMRRRMYILFVCT